MVVGSLHDLVYRGRLETLQAGMGQLAGSEGIEQGWVTSQAEANTGVIDSRWNGPTKSAARLLHLADAVSGHHSGIVRRRLLMLD